MFQNITLNGITSLEDYPNLKYYKECLENKEIYIPQGKPDIQSLEEVRVSISVEEYKIINTILGTKILLNGTQKIRIVYTADNFQESIHTSNYNVPFCEFILLDNITYEQCKEHINNIFIGIEDINVCKYDKKTVTLSILFIISPEIIANEIISCNEHKNTDNIN